MNRHRTRLSVCALEAIESPTSLAHPLAAALEPAAWRAWTAPDQTDLAAIAVADSMASVTGDMGSLSQPAMPSQAEAGTTVAVPAWSADEPPASAPDSTANAETWSMFPTAKSPV